VQRDVEEKLTKALAATTPAAAWAEIEPLRPQITEDRELAAVWVTLLQASPQRPFAEEDTRAVLATFRTDAELVATAVTTLVRIADLVPFDEPRPADDAAAFGALAAQRALDPASQRSLDAGQRGALLVALGNAMSRLGPARDAEAVAAFEEAIRIEGRPDWLSDLGVCHKRARRFRAALIAFQKAAEKGKRSRALSFHLALTGIATGEHAVARDALLALGMKVEGEGDARPFVPDLPPVQVRMTTVGTGHAIGSVVPDESASFERVLMQPLSPVHGVLRTPTHREAIADYGDVVLVDPAPVTKIVDGDRAIPVLGVLGVLAKGDERRFRFLALEQKEGDAAAIGAALPESVVMYVHGARVERVCPRCAAGETLTRHEHLPDEEHRAVFGKILAPGSLPLKTLARSLEAARAARPGVLLAVPGLFEAMGETASAGKAHKTWGVIERGVLARTPRT
jgi:hypothetical protein